VLDGEFGRRFFDRMAEASGLRVLAIFDNGGYRSFSNRVREVRSPDDLAGLKIRVIESPTEMKIVESLGATPTPIAWRELYSALQTGVVDGQENSPATLLSGSLHEVQPHYTLDHHTLSLAAIVVGEEWFRSRPPALQRSLRLAGQMASVAGRGAAWSNNKLALDYLASEGVQIYRPDSAQRQAFRERAQPAVIEWMRANPEIDDTLLDELLAAVAEAEQELGLQ
jgi:TRAP-type C4-dicarboxylate transport system substrate-binding protein